MLTMVLLKDGAEVQADEGEEERRIGCVRSRFKYIAICGDCRSGSRRCCDRLRRSNCALRARETISTHSGSVVTIHSLFGTRGAQPCYEGDTLHVLTTPSSPAVAKTSSKPFLGHHATLFTSCTSCAEARRAMGRGASAFLLGSVVLRTTCRDRSVTRPSATPMCLRSSAIR